MSDLNLVRTLAATLSDAELYDACNILSVAHKNRSNIRAQALKEELCPGDCVTWLGSGPARGEVQRIKRRKAIVVEVTVASNGEKAYGSSWDVPLSMLTKVY